MTFAYLTIGDVIALQQFVLAEHKVLTDDRAVLYNPS